MAAGEVRLSAGSFADLNSRAIFDRIQSEAEPCLKPERNGDRPGLLVVDHAHVDMGHSGHADHHRTAPTDREGTALRCRNFN